MKLKILEQTSETVHVALHGELDMKGVQEISVQFSELSAAKRIHTIVDFSKVTYIASLGLAMLVTAAQELSRYGKKLVLIGAKRDVMDTISQTGLQRLIAFADNLEEARAVFKSPES